MEPDWYLYPIAFFLGLAVGFINTMAGGGSLLTLPLLMLGFGLPAEVANGTNRVSITLQNLSASLGFRSKGISPFPLSIWMGLAALPGVVLGAIYANHVDREVFNHVLAGIMVVMTLVLIRNPFKGKDYYNEVIEGKMLVVTLGMFFLIGLYIGFIQAGAGFLVIMALALVNKFDLVRTNAIKVVVIFICNVVALSVFVFNGNVDWVYGFTLAAGTSLGAYFGSRWQVGKGSDYIRWVMIVMILVTAMKLMGWLDWLL